MTKMLQVLKRDAGKFCLKWDRFHENVTSMFDHLRQSEKLVDVTLCSESQKVKVHRLTMSACSPYLRDLLKDNPCEHPVIVLTDTTAFELNAIVEFMYKGSVYLPHIQLESFMKTLEMLQMEGICSKEDKTPPASVVTRLSSSQSPVPEASTSEQRSPHHEPHRSSPRPTKSVQESSPVPRTASPSPPPPPTTISPWPPEPDSVTDSDLEDMEPPYYDSPAVDPLFCPESKEQLLALKKQLGESPDLVKAEEGEIKIEKNILGVDEVLIYDAELYRGYSDNEVSAGKSADAAVNFVPPVDAKPDPTYQTADEESLNDEKADVSDPVCRTVRRSWIPCNEASHDEVFNDETSGDRAEEGCSGKDTAQQGGRYQPRRSTRLRKTDTARRQTRQTDTWQANEDRAEEDKRKQPPDPASGAAQSEHGSYYCQHCKCLCSSQAQLDQHIRHRHGHAGMKGSRKFEGYDYTTNFSTNVKRHQRVHGGKRPHACKVCGKAFKFPRDLFSHQRVHTGERPYTCNVCGKAFKNPRDVIRHKRTHTGEKPYTCDVCGKAVTSSGSLINHKRLHTGERPYQCNLCGKEYTCARLLMRHQPSHTGERPYTCSVCGKTFVHSDSVMRHKRIHHGERL